MSFKFNERTFLKAVSKMEKDIGRTTDVLLWPRHARHRVHACMCTHTVRMLFLMATSWCLREKNSGHTLKVEASGFPDRLNPRWERMRTSGWRCCFWPEQSESLVKLTFSGKGKMWKGQLWRRRWGNQFGGQALNIKLGMRTRGWMLDRDVGGGSSWRYRLEESPTWVRYLKQWAGWGFQGHTYEGRTEEVAPWSWQSPCISRDPRFGEGPEKVTEKEYQQRGRKYGRVDYSGGQENSIYRKEDAYHPTREGWKGRSWNVWLYHRG